MNKTPIMVQYLTICVIVFFSIKSNCTYAQETSYGVTNFYSSYFHFWKDDPYINELYMSNSEVLDQIDDFLTSHKILSNRDTLTIIASSSPDGLHDYNLKLAHSRVLYLKQLLLSRYPALERVIIETDADVVDWSKCKELIKNDLKLPFRSEVIEIIDQNKSIESIGIDLKQLKNGESWQYIKKHILPKFRNAYVYIRLSVKEPSLNISLQHKTFNKLTNEPLQIDRNILRDYPLGIVKSCETKYSNNNHFALKTNLLFDVISIVNLELEVPIGNRFSILGGIVFPWWTFDNGQADSKRHRIQLLNANLEGRYWFGDRTKKLTMTGWFAGLYIGGGLYDFEYNAAGYQSESLLIGGVSGGYSHSINKEGSLRMEYSLGIGYMVTDYIYYQSHFAPTGEWHPMYQESGRYSLFGPTQAKISLVWMLNKREGVR